MDIKAFDVVCEYETLSHCLANVGCIVERTTGCWTVSKDGHFIANVTSLAHLQGIYDAFRWCQTNQAYLDNMPIPDDLPIVNR